MVNVVQQREHRDRVTKAREGDRPNHQRPFVAQIPIPSVYVPSV